jgi:hypothetical protein
MCCVYDEGSSSGIREAVIAIAVSGHKVVNWIERRTFPGTSARERGLNPVLRKNVTAVVVSRYAVNA